jgi:flagellin-like protein
MTHGGERRGRGGVVALVVLVAIIVVLLWPARR